MQYKYWVRTFAKDKKLIATFDLCHIDSIHTIKRYIDLDNRLWESAITFTNKIVFRWGLPAEDGASIYWNAWETLHEVEFE